MQDRDTKTSETEDKGDYDDGGDVFARVACGTNGKRRVLRLGGNSGSRRVDIDLRSDVRSSPRGTRRRVTAGSGDRNWGCGKGAERIGNKHR